MASPTRNGSSASKCATSASRTGSWDGTTSPCARKTTTARPSGWRRRWDGRGSSRHRPGSPTSGSDYRIVGAAWGAPIDRVEVKIDDGPWMPATIDHSEEAEFAWKIWTLDWPNPPPESTPSPRGRSTERQRPAGDGRSLDRQEAHLLGKQRASDAPHSARLTAQQPETYAAGSAPPVPPNTSRTAPGSRIITYVTVGGFLQVRPDRPAPSHRDCCWRRYGRFHHAELVGLIMAQSCQSGWVSEIEHGRFWPGLLGHAADKE